MELDRRFGLRGHGKNLFPTERLALHEPCEQPPHPSALGIERLGELVRRGRQVDADHIGSPSLRPDSRMGTKREQENFDLLARPRHRVGGASLVPPWSPWPT